MIDMNRVSDRVMYIDGKIYTAGQYTMDLEGFEEENGRLNRGMEAYWDLMMIFDWA